MAVLTSEERAEIRRRLAGGNDPVPWTKAQINAAMQAVEDFFETNRPALSSAINTATAPLILSPSQKARLVREWLGQKFARGG